MSDDRCPVCGQRAHIRNAKCSENLVEFGGWVGDEREKALEEAAKECETFQTRNAHVMAAFIRNLKGCK